MFVIENNFRAVAGALIGGGSIFIYSGAARLVSFEIKLISKEVSRAEPEYMNIHPPPPISVLATAPNNFNNENAEFNTSKIVEMKVVNLEDS